MLAAAISLTSIVLVLIMELLSLGVFYHGAGAGAVGGLISKRTAVSKSEGDDDWCGEFAGNPK